MTATAKFKTTDAVDFLIVGSGSAGGVLAKELSSNGFQVVVLEQGPRIEPGQFEHDEYWAINLNALSNNLRQQPTTFRESENETAKRKPIIWYGRVVGGGSVHFTTNYWRFHELDFVERSRKGSIPGADLQDWPITYNDLEPYYTKAEWELGVSGQAGASPFDPPRSKPYPLPPLPIKSSGVLMERGARKLGWHPFPAPMAIISEDYQGRHKCMHCGFCEAFGCEWGAKSSTLATVIPIAERTGRCEIRPDCYVHEIEVNAQGRVTGVVYFDKQKRSQRQKAKAVILCANGAETPKLLLMSKSGRFPDGLANSNGVVGKYLMFDTGAMSGGVFEHPLNEYKGAVVSRIVHDFYEIDPKHGFLGGAGLDTRFDLNPAGFAQCGFAPDMPQWGSEFKKNLRDFPRMMYTLSHHMALAVESNSITLDPVTKDAWGLPAIRVTYKDHPDTFKSLQFMQDREMELLDAAGAQKSWRLPYTERDSSAHLLGTCRMGNDPKKSVVNSDHRTHDVPNLFICDGSSLVTSGRNQPTETIQALAFRAADRITTLAKKVEI
jgi:choline dehydrogenase-like flavoprotein